MEKKQLDILRNSKNVEILSAKIDAKDVIRQAIQKYPAYFTRRDLDAIRVKSTESRYRYIVDKFKDVSDGYVKLFTVLVETGHTDAVLKILRPGLTVKVMAPPPRSAEATKSEGIDQEDIKSGRNATSEVERMVKQLCTELNEVKEKIKDIEKQQSIEHMSQMLQVQGGKDVMSELEYVKTELRQVKLWMEEQCGMMTNRIDNLERESTGRKIARGDVKTIAVKIQTQWEVIAKEVGIEGETIKHSRGKQVLEGEAAAEAFISQWIEMDGKAAMATGIPPTYDALYEIVKRRDEKVAEEIKELQKHAKK
ncbi:uncharacterized protein LOC144438890 isoform X2 [Glandiceps talaboti]